MIKNEAQERVINEIDGQMIVIAILSPMRSIEM